MQRGFALAACLAQTGCSLILDFSDKAIPIDAAPDTPFNDAECAFGEPNDSLDTPIDFDISSVGPAAICNTGVDDEDYYKFVVPPGTTSITVQISFIFFQSGDLDLYLYDGNKTQLAFSPNTGDGEKIVCPGTAPLCTLPMPVEGNYIFRVHPAVPGSQNRYDIAVTLAQ